MNKVMKANAPEKIYLQQYDENTLICLNKWNISDEWTNKPFNEKVVTNIEYTRTDAFIEKALKFIKTNVDRIVNNQHGVCMGCMDVEFRKYMEGKV